MWVKVHVIDSKDSLRNDLGTKTTASRQLQEIQNKKNSENRHLVFSIFNKKEENNGVGAWYFVFISKTFSKKTTKSMIVDDISSLFQRRWQCLWNKGEISPTPLFSCFFMNIENTRCLFAEFVLFCIIWTHIHEYSKVYVKLLKVHAKV